ncbi:MAG: cob(I)yrinic acid a,c-diamide adenosyltransferase [Treponema sp.]|jgi:cob(I)alamin adenosyltransferase|nr:cob(I)yrinic acid a,c-diamide adenosyltransferase [Treponema sp.]
MIHIYTGDGKGKTTAAMGLAIRAAGRGKKVVIAQFMKGADTGELHSLALLPNITVLRFTKSRGFFSRVDAETRTQMTEDNNSTLAAALGMPWDMLILDEVFSAYALEALDAKTIDDLVFNQIGERELVLTGRKAPQRFIDAADYVSEIRKIKHPYDRGVKAREGIEY